MKFSGFVIASEKARLSDWIYRPRISFLKAGMNFFEQNGPKMEVDPIFFVKDRINQRGKIARNL